MNEDRIIELEIKAAHQEDLLQSLNLVVCDQQKQITRLEEMNKILNEKIKSINVVDDVNHGAEIPPHY